MGRTLDLSLLLEDTDRGGGEEDEGGVRLLNVAGNIHYLLHGGFCMTDFVVVSLLLIVTGTLCAYSLLFSLDPPEDRINDRA